MKIVSSVDGVCSRCKKKYDANSEIFLIKSMDFMKLWRGDPKEITLQNAIENLDMMENDKGKHLKVGYYVYHLKCWEKLKQVILEIYSGTGQSDTAFGRGIDLITSDPQFTYDETDDFMSRHKGPEDRVIDR